MIRQLTQRQLYSFCCRLMFELGEASKYDPRLKNLKSVDIKNVKENSVFKGDTRPLTFDE